MMTVPPGQHRSADYGKKAAPEALVGQLLSQGRRKIYERFIHHFPERPDWRVLDLGCNASQTDPARYFFESRYPFKDQVVACGLEPPTAIREAYPQIRYFQTTRGAPLPFRDAEFDLVFCNAVIEHVGTRPQQAAFLSEVLRVGANAFITTPNRWYPVEFHTVLPFLHYLPPRAYRSIYKRLGLEFFSLEENLNLLDTRALRELLPANCRHAVELDCSRFLGLPSNLLLIARRALSRHR